MRHLLVTAAAPAHQHAIISNRLLSVREHSKEEKARHLEIQHQTCIAHPTRKHRRSARPAMLLRPSLAPHTLQGIADSLASIPSLLPLLHQLEEHSPSASAAGHLAAAILEDLVAFGSPAASDAIASLRAATRAHKQALAARRREAVLRSMSLRQVGGIGQERVGLWVSAWLDLCQ